jgi:hypothetical protein
MRLAVELSHRYLSQEQRRRGELQRLLRYPQKNRLELLLCPKDLKRVPMHSARLRTPLQTHRNLFYQRALRQIEEADQRLLH